MSIAACWLSSRTGVMIVAVGMLTNLSELLKEPARPKSNVPASGAEPVRRKVKQWVCMGGNFVASRRPTT